MATQRLKLHTGPVGVAEIADKVRAAGIAVVCEGTETVYIDVEAPDKTEAAYVYILAMEKVVKPVPWLPWL
jgi:hypothetical protein